MFSEYGVLEQTLTWKIYDLGLLGCVFTSMLKKVKNYNWNIGTRSDITCNSYLYFSVVLLYI